MAIPRLPKAQLPSGSFHTTAMPCIAYFHNWALPRNFLQVEKISPDKRKPGRLVNLVFPRLMPPLVGADLSGPVSPEMKVYLFFRNRMSV